MRKFSFIKEFDSYREADAWLMAGGYRECIVNLRHSGETIIILEGEYAERAYDAEHGPLMPGGFRLSEVERLA